MNIAGFMVQRLFVRVLLRAEKVQGDVWCITHDPTVVAGRPGRNVEEHAGAEFVDRAVIHRSRGTAGEHQTNVLDGAARRAHAGSDMEGPLPPGLIRSAADGHTPDANKFESPFLERPYLVRLVKTLQNCFQLRQDSLLV
jgi:hypothetical protein